MATSGKECWYLLVIHDGQIRYWNDWCKGFRSGKPEIFCLPHPFESEEAAMACYDQWARKNPTLAVDWLPRVEKGET